MIRPTRVPSRGSQRSIARPSSADGGPACWASGSQGPRVSSLGTEALAVQRVEGTGHGGDPIACRAMQAVTFQAPGEVRVDERPEPELLERDDAIVRVEATGICGSDLHIYHGRVQIEPGFTLGHEFVGTVIAAGDGVTEVAEGDRVLGCYCSACGNCFFCRRGDFHKCDEGRVFGHGKTLGSLQGAQAEQVLVPHANLTLRRVPEGMSDDAALFAGDVMGTGWHAVDQAGIRPGDTAAVLGLGPVGLCAVQAAKAAGAAKVIAIDTVADRLDHGRRVRRRAGPPHRGGPARGRQERNRRAAAWTPRSTPSATRTRSTSPRG